MKYVVCILLFMSFKSSYGAPLSNEALFNRCYSHLTKKRVNSSHQLLQQVKDGSLDPIQACLSVFNKAKLGQNNRISVNDSESRAVIKNMTDLHNSFFSERSLRLPNTCMRLATLDFRDELAPAMYYTYALLAPNADVSNILKGESEYRGIRATPSPTNRGPASEGDAHVRTENNTSVPWNVSSAFLGTGDLVGVTTSPVLMSPQFNQDMLSSIGGGVIGSRVYLQRSFRGQSERADGGLKMNRRWAQAVARDFLCRELPLVRETDGLPFIKTDSQIAFRQQSACIGCHATMDRMAGAVRNVTLVTTGRDGCDTRNKRNYTTQHMITRTSDRPSADSWPKDADRDYYRRPSEGYLYFRSYNGDLIHKAFSNIEELGQKMAETNDFYVCAAKKYYQFFTGIDVSLADINDPFSTVKLNEEDMKHRKTVIELGLDLKNHKDLSKLLENIISSPTYKLSDYGIQGGL